MEFTWQNATNLVSIKNGNKEIVYTYDGSGIRTSKTVNGVIHNYTFDSTMILSESYGSNIILFIYDESGSPMGIAYRNTSYEQDVFDKYIFTKNLQGDIIGIYSEDGTCVAEYSYDAWGNHTVTNHTTDNIGDINPFRYRGYYFDVESNFYFLNTRYYDPQIKRFISSDVTGTLTDTPMSLTDKNLYAYCDNNPVMRVDNGGQFWDTFFDVISLAASIVEVAVNPYDPWAWAGLVGDVVDLVPFVSGVGEITRSVNTTRKVADKVGDVTEAVVDGVKLQKAVDFTDDAVDTIKALDRSSGFTKSTASAGRKIHKGYKATPEFIESSKEFNKVRGIRPDYVDFDNKIIYELKPFNPKSIKSGIKQLQKYNQKLGGGFKMILEVY